MSGDTEIARGLQARLAREEAAPGSDRPGTGSRAGGADQLARITTIAPDQATGLRKLLFWAIRRRTRGFIPGVFTIILADLRVGLPMSWLAGYLGMRASSPLSRVQQEMVATVVNGTIGGAP